MKRRILLILCVAAIAVIGIFALTACGALSVGGGRGNGGNTHGNRPTEFYVYFESLDGEFADGSRYKRIDKLSESEVDAAIENFEKPTLDEYIFDGWYTDSECTDKWSGIADWSGEADPNGAAAIQLYAGYKQTKFKLVCRGAETVKLGDVTFDDGKIASGKFEENDRVTVTITRSKYEVGRTFLGWYDGEELLCEDMSYTFAMPSKDMELIARWVAYKITITNGVGGTGKVKRTNDNTFSGVYRGDVADENTTVTALADEGYYFVGWYDENDRLLSTDSAYTFTMPHENVSLSTKWSYYTVTTQTADDDGGNAGSIVDGYDETKVSPEHDVVLHATVNDGYMFVGWFDGAEKISTEPEYTVTMPRGNKTYTAKWTYYTATTLMSIKGDCLDINACVIIDGYDHTKVSPGDDVTLKVTFADTYSFIGWYESDELLSEDTEYTVTMPARDVVYTARFGRFTVIAESNVGGTALAYRLNRTVTFLSSDGTTVLGTQTLGYGDRIDVEAANALINKSGFKGWLASDGFYEFDAEVTNDLTLRAVYYDHYVPYDSWVDISQYSAPSFYKEITVGNSHYFAAPVTGDYTFYYRQGYYDLSNGKNPYYGPIIRLYNTTRNEWIFQNSNDAGIAKPDDKENQYFNSQWSFSAKAGDVIRIDCESYPWSTSDYAHYYVEGNRLPKSGGGLANFASDDATPMSAGENIMLKAVADEGYSFVGWHDGTAIVSTDKEYTFVMGKSNAIYTAKWKKYTVTAASRAGGNVALSPTSATVTFDLNGKPGTAPEPQTVTRTHGLTMPPRPTASNYIFRGWYTDAACSGEAFDFSSEITGDMTLFAGWQSYYPSATAWRHTVIYDIERYTEDTPFRDNALSPIGQDPLRPVVIYFVIPVSGNYRLTAHASHLLYNSGRGVVVSTSVLRDDGTAPNFGIDLYLESDGVESSSVATLLAGDVVQILIYRRGDMTYINSHELYCWFDYLGEAEYPAKDGGVLGTGAEAVTAVTTDEQRAFAAGTEVTVKATAESGHTFVGWHDGTSIVSTDAEYTFVMPDGNINLTAQFE